MVTTLVTPIDPSAGVEGILEAITTAINANQVAILGVAGGLLAITVLFKFAKRFVK